MKFKVFWAENYILIVVLLAYLTIDLCKMIVGLLP